MKTKRQKPMFTYRVCVRINNEVIQIGGDLAVFPTSNRNRNDDVCLAESYLRGASTRHVLANVNGKNKIPMNSQALVDHIDKLGGLRRFCKDFDPFLIWKTIDELHDGVNHHTTPRTVSSKLRNIVLRRDNYTCKLCNKNRTHGVQLHIDHITPYSKGGETVETNLQTLCRTCNLQKSNKDL